MHMSPSQFLSRFQRPFLLLVILGLIYILYWKNNHPTLPTRGQQQNWIAQTERQELAMANFERYHSMVSPSTIDEVPTSIRVTGEPAPESCDPATFREMLKKYRAWSDVYDPRAEIQAAVEEFEKNSPECGFAEVIEAKLLSRGMDERPEPRDRFDQAVRKIEASVTKNPYLVEARIEKARLLLLAQEDGNALWCLDLASTLEPNHPELAKYRGRLLVHNGYYLSANEWFEKFIALSDEPALKASGYYWLAQSHAVVVRDNFQELEIDVERELRLARDAFEKALEQGPNSSATRLNYAVFLNQEAADYESAEQQARQSAATTPRRLAAYHIAAAQYQKLGTEAERLPAQELRSRLQTIQSDTGIPLDEAILYPRFSRLIRERLIDLRAVSGPLEQVEPISA